MRRSFDESDLIRLRLRRLEKLTSDLPLADKLFTTAPVLPFAICFMAGIWFIDLVDPTSCFWGVFCVGLCFTCGLFLLAFKADSSMKLMLTLSAACIGSFIAGMSCYYATLYVGPNHISRCLRQDRQLATLKGKVISPIVNAERSSSIPWKEPQSSFYLQVQSIKSQQDWIDVKGTVRVQVGEHVNHICAGNTVFIYCWLSRFSPPPNPGQFDLQKYMARKGVYAAASVPIKEGVEVLDDSISWIAYLRSCVSLFCDDALLDESLPDKEVRDMSAALLLGRRENLKPEVMAAFNKTNLTHYISLSGQNVGIFAGSLWILLRTIGIAKRPRAVLCIFIIVLYALAVPDMPAINRAVFLAIFIFASFVIRRQTSPLNTLAVSALVLLFFRPSELFSTGWQLSYLSVLGILLFYEPVVFYLRETLFYPAVFMLRARFVAFQQLLYYIFDLLAVGVAAWTAIAGILLYYFGSINPFSPLWTVLVFPFVLVLLYAGYIKIVIAKLLPGLAAILSVLIDLASRGFESSVLFFSRIDFGRIISSRPPVITVILIYAVILILLFLPFFYRRTRLSLYFACAILFVQPSCFQSAQSFSNASLELTCLSVGHGQAIVLSGPHKKHFLFDAGSITTNDAAGRIVLSFLQHKGISSLDAVYVSHSDMDHINGLTKIAPYVRIENLYANSEFFNGSFYNSTAQNIKRSLAELNVIAEPVKNFAGTDGMTIRSLWPTGEETAKEELSDNDKSQVFLIEFKGRRILLCGDIELYAQQKILSLYPLLKIDVMVLPHHGSTVNLDARFIEQLEPKIVIASCSISRIETWQAPQASDIQVFHTATDGAVTVKIKADGTLSADGFL